MGQKMERVIDIVFDLVELLFVVLAWTFLFWGEPKYPLTAGLVIAALFIGGIGMFFDFPRLVEEKAVSVKTLLGACSLLAVGLAILAILQVGLWVQGVRILVALVLLVISVRVTWRLGTTFYIVSKDRKQLDSAARTRNDEPMGTE